VSRYRNLLPLLIHTEDGSYAQGEEFEKDFSPEDELENLNSGLLELLPRKYRVIGGSDVDGHEPGSEFEAAIPLAREAQLVNHIERVETPVAKPKRKKKEE